MNNFFKEELIKLDLNTKNREETIEQLTEMLYDTGYLTSKDIFLQDVLAREEEGSTAIGFQIAIPHGKSVAAKDSAIGFGRLNKEIQWGDSDESVDTVFLIAVPEEKASNEHLKILASLSRALMNESFRDKMKQAQTKSELLDILKNYPE